MKKIKIAEPCHENWSDFTSTQRGAFCGKCQINVIDFSKKSNKEIKNVLAQNSGKHMCGRFYKTQIEVFNSDYSLWQNQSQNTFQSKFIFALILVFGLTLFSCSNKSKTVNVEKISNIITTESKTISTNPSTIVLILDIESKIKTIDKLKPEICITEFEMGDIKIEEPIEMSIGEIQNEQSDEKFIKKGKMVIEEPEVIEIIQLENNHLMTSGVLDYYDTSNNTPANLSDTIKDNSVTSLTDKFESNLYPNPIKNKATLDINVLLTENYQINISDSQGQLIRMVYSGSLSVGMESFKLNMYNYVNGIYYIQIVTNTQNESLKIIKSN